MNNKLLENLEFSIGFKAKMNIEFNKKNYLITLKLQAYEESDGITEQQHNSYTNFEREANEKLKKVESLIISRSESSLDDLEPTMLFIDRNGDLALLFDNTSDPEDGVAVQIYPKLKLTSQDDYL